MSDNPYADHANAGRRALLAGDAAGAIAALEWLVEEHKKPEWAFMDASNFVEAITLLKRGELQRAGWLLMGSGFQRDV